MNKNLSYKISVCVFTLPTLILFTVVVCNPILQTIYKSFFDWDGISAASFINIQNYVKLFHDSDFFTASNNGLIFAAFLVIYQTGLATIFAILFANKDLKGRKFFKSAYFIPVVLSVTVVSMLWLTVYNTDNGIINKVLKLMGSPYRQSWLSNMKTGIYAVAFVNAWQYMGIQMILIFAAIKSIPEHYYEAASIDGASSFQKHIHVTMPMLAETYKFCLVLAITGGLKAFENMYIMTQGGPGTATYTLTYLMYSAAFRSNQYGYACSAATILVVQCLVFTILVNRFVAREKIKY